MCQLKVQCSGIVDMRSNWQEKLAKLRQVTAG